ncbi:MAG: putative transporter [Bacteroidaceae bacterium]|nr:putative transporter [Candidatus Equimonas faecalis]MCQ2206042.1 putative transporter [Bacteroidaceae bacterium]
MWLLNLISGSGVAHNVLLLASIIAIGLILSRIKIAGVSLGVTWVLFAGIVASHFGLVIDDTTSHFIKEFGLILFIYSIGLQVGPSFFSSFRKGGVILNALSLLVILLGTLTAYVIHLITGENLLSMVGVLCGAVTNTPALGAAQQTFSDMQGGAANPIFAQGYAVCYPLGVVGIILAIILLRYILRVRFENETAIYENNTRRESTLIHTATLCVENQAVVGHNIGELHKLLDRDIVITRLKHPDSDDILLVKSESKLQMGDRLFIVGHEDDIEAYAVLIGRKLTDIDQQQWDEDKHNNLVSARVVVTNGKLQGKRLGDLNLRRNFHVTFTRVKRAGIDLIANPSLILQVGDRVTVVGSAENVKRLSQFLGNTVGRLDQPQLFSTFLGIALGVVLGSLPIFIPGIPVPVKVGLAGGPLIVSILLSCYGPKYHLITYTTNSAKLLMREIGISMFMAAVGLSAGVGFVDTLMAGGYLWVLYGFIITVLPCIIVGILARTLAHRSYFTIAGIISGAMTNPAALAYSNSLTDNDQASVAYSTVYPVTMFLRVLVAQILVLIAL